MTSIRTALLALGALALMAGSALAFGHDRGGHEGGRGGYAGALLGDARGGARGGYQRGYPGPGYPGGARSYAPQGYAPYDPPAFGRGRRDMGDLEAPNPAFAPRSFRRGQYIPRPYWSGEIANLRARHLRTPPPGYGWVGVGPNAYLMQRSTGLVLDSVPGAW